MSPTRSWPAVHTGVTSINGCRTPNRAFPKTAQLRRPADFGKRKAPGKNGGFPFSGQKPRLSRRARIFLGEGGKKQDQRPV